MARPKAFERETALDAAVAVFREHGFEGTSAGMLVEAMGIGRQSLYDTFGDKRRLYLAALQRYAQAEIEAHLTALQGESGAFRGINAVMQRVVSEARRSCLGVNSICEFGNREAEVNAINASADRALRAALVGRIAEAQSAGDISGDLDADSVVDFLSASFSGIRIAARAGADEARLQALGQLALRALR